MKKTIACILFVAVFCALNAAPMITVDTPDVNMGSIRTNSTDKIEYSFIIKNTGDKPLIINRVKPGCGCTVVKYDSIIAPGSTGKLTPQVKLREGTTTFRKSMVVFSNAKNAESLTLTIGGKILNVVDVSEDFLHIVPDTAGKLKSMVILSTAKNDFTVEKIEFIENKSTNTPTWQSSLPVPVTFTITKSPKTNTDGYYSFTVDFMIGTAPPASVNGDLILSTNHPEKRNVTIRVLIDTKEEPKVKK